MVSKTFIYNFIIYDEVIYKVRIYSNLEFQSSIKFYDTVFVGH